ncbi:tetratricopeptide repeat protein [Endozoicomonas gorgoniicola]|uniref:Tetratricopeptide repeat protein n=1 Tax=Endozoicomonas gorgoniicola TaxID=1234144 RepID=A0ABT3MU32_9GAMM|nr:tetratricopeptide repeat protein [Endozoicomonas gorgoniicola]MCW7552873.1 tetratricopeptide repeat protein [Endozoicomonas gorgoniicola]
MLPESVAGWLRNTHIYEVRNAISHPNRPFWDCYWYRVASIATDPVNEILGLQEIKKTFLAAEAGTIQDPPEEWLSKIIWQIPNNLPNQFDHGVTGLIGRTSELGELKKLISNQRVNTIALVAPGGTGKTALALDLLSAIVSTPAYSKHIDAVVYTTLKTEKLTAEGVVPLDAVETISELKRSIVNSLNEIFDDENDSFDDSINSYKNKNILLCLDNLETLLRDNHDSFENLNHSLPVTWKVLVTSRVSITNSSVLSLNVLKEKSAIHLARTYLKKRGANPLEENAYKKLTKECHYNPLAIRLTLDLVIKGKPIPDSLNVANKEIAEFSYNNLIETLSDNSIQVLEAIFVEDSSSRMSLCELLGLSLDDVSSSIGELSRTSLIKRESTDQNETYSLSDSVRDLLLISPKNIDARNKVQNLINKRRVLSKEIDIKQDQRDIPEWHVDYIPKDTNQNLKILITEINKKIKKAFRNTDIAVSLYRKLQEAKYIYDDNALYHRSFARVSEALKDFNGAEREYKKAISIDSNNAQSYYLLGRLYHDTNRYDESLEIYQKLIDDGWTREESDIVSFGRSIYNGYFLSLLYSGKYSEVLDKTKKWKESDIYRGILGAYRASAWKRKMENLVDINPNPDEAVDALVRAARILSDVFRNDGYLRTACAQARKVFEEIEFCFSRDEYCSKFPEQGLELLEMVSEHILEFGDSRDSFNSKIIEKLSKVNIDNNPFKSKKWRTYLKSDSIIETPSEYEVKDFISVKIHNRPKDRASFLFAKDAFGETYFLHFDKLKNGAWQEWCKLSLGANLEVIPDEDKSQPNKAKEVQEIFLVD